jgi:hypothetical protein
MTLLHELSNPTTPMNLPIFQRLAEAKTVLLAGAGGGYDLFAGLPVLHWLLHRGKRVHLANLTFSDLRYEDCERPVPALARITPDSHGSASHCPELHLSRWLSDQFGTMPIYLLERTGVAPVITAYRWLAEELRPDAIVLVDGGTDILMRGDEVGLGTPQEDMASLMAVSELNAVPDRFVLSVGFGVDAFHGVCHAHVLENIAALTADDGFLGSWSLLKQSAEFAFYRAACDYVASRLPKHPSIVNTSIIDATTGWFGNHHGTKRTEGSELFINPLMSLYWAFTVESVARRNLYLDRIKQTTSYPELTLAIEVIHNQQPNLRQWRDIPC